MLGDFFRDELGWWKKLDCGKKKKKTICEEGIKIELNDVLDYKKTRGLGIDSKNDGGEGGGGRKFVRFSKSKYDINLVLNFTVKNTFYILHYIGGDDGDKKSHNVPSKISKKLNCDL